MANKTSKWTISDEEFERQYAAAKKRGQEELAKGVYATAARYDKASKRIIVELANGATLLIPAQLIQELQDGTAKELAEIEILGVGSALYWSQLEADISVAGLLQGIFGSRTWMTELGRAGGKVTTDKKQAAARANGQLGGRPKTKETSATKTPRLKKAV